MIHVLQISEGTMPAISPQSITLTILKLQIMGNNNDCQVDQLVVHIQGKMNKQSQTKRKVLRPTDGITNYIHSCLEANT